ncbi:hypothetical protein ACVME5_006070 [Bradyrhizobium liaoningense]
MTLFEVVRDPTLSRFYNALPCPLVLRKRSFQRLLDHDNVGLRCDQVWISCHTPPIC